MTMVSSFKDTTVDRIRIAVEPELTETYGPEIYWCWRTLLVGSGWRWVEVPIGSDCDIAYVSQPEQAPTAQLCIQADANAWIRPSLHRLDRVQHPNGLSHLVFQSQAVSPDPDYTFDNRVICSRDLIFDLFWLATGQEEQYWPTDNHGFLDLTGTAVLHEKLLHQAPASQIIRWFEKTLIKLGYPPPIPRWPADKRAAAAVGHDVDYPEIKRWLEPVRIVARQGWQGLGPALAVLSGRLHHWQFPAWVELEKHLQTRSAFYFVPRQGGLLEYATGTPDPFYDVTSPRFRELFHCLTAEGFEVGLHPSYLAYQSREKFAAEKERLEEASGQVIVGNRHHYWHLNPEDVEETLLIHEQVGLKYDTSLIHNRYLGWRRGLSQPYFPFHQGERRQLKTLQIPTAWMDDQLFGLQADNPGERCAVLRNLADRTAEQGGCLLIDIHDYVFEEALFPGWTQTYRQLWEYLLGRGDFWFATPAQIAEHWINRSIGIVEASQGLTQGLG
jgi:hypothetical protein